MFACVVWSDALKQRELYLISLFATNGRHLCEGMQDFVSDNKTLGFVGYL